jgi:arginase family enzyme
VDLNNYFNPISLERPKISYLSEKTTFSHNITIHTENTKIPALEPFDVAIIGVKEDRFTINKGCALAPDYIRGKLYQLNKFQSNINVIDLGNLKPGSSINDTFYAIRDVIFELTAKNVITILLGGSNSILFACQLIQETLNQPYNLITLDAKLDLESIHDEPEDSITSDNYLYRIMEKDQNNLLFNYTNIGHQVYFVEQKNIDFINKSLYESKRLGMVRNELHLAEPLFRDASYIGVDINVVRQSDAPGNVRPSPNGFYGEEICQLTRYAGMSNKINTFGLFEINPRYDENDQTAHLGAQMVWYFLEGFTQRQNEAPGNNKEFKKFIVNLDDTHNKELIFYKSTITEKWWFEVPSIQLSKKEVVACAYEDYLLACKGEIPERWLKIFQKMN